MVPVFFQKLRAQQHPPKQRAPPAEHLLAAGLDLLLEQRLLPGHVRLAQHLQRKFRDIDRWVWGTQHTAQHHGHEEHTAVVQVSAGGGFVAVWEYGAGSKHLGETGCR